VLLTGIVALLFSVGLTPPRWSDAADVAGVAGAAGFVLVLSFGINKLSTTAAQACSGPMRR
jgi:hypothetical protein